MKPTNFIIRLEIYPFDLLVSVNESDEVLSKNLIDNYGYKENEIELLMDFGPTKLGRYVLLHNNTSVIRLRTHKDKYLLMNVISHEVLHYVTYVFDRLGSEFKLGTSDEHYAYTLGYVVEQICRKLKL